MGTFYWYFEPRNASFMDTNFAQLKEVIGTNLPAAGLYYDTTTVERAFFKFKAINYSTGDLTLKVSWYADSATSGGVTWETALAAISPGDAQDVETKAFATVNTANQSHAGTVGQRLHEVTVTMTNLDSLAAGDTCILRLSRLTTDASDNMSGDAVFYGAELSYTST